MGSIGLSIFVAICFISVAYGYRFSVRSSECCDTIESVNTLSTYSYRAEYRNWHLKLGTLPILGIITLILVPFIMCCCCCCAGCPLYHARNRNAGTIIQPVPYQGISPQNNYCVNMMPNQPATGVDHMPMPETTAPPSYAQACDTQHPSTIGFQQ